MQYDFQKTVPDFKCHHVATVWLKPGAAQLLLVRFLYDTPNNEFGISLE